MTPTFTSLARDPLAQDLAEGLPCLGWYMEGPRVLAAWRKGIHALGLAIAANPDFTEMGLLNGSTESPAVDALFCARLRGRLLARGVRAEVDYDALAARVRIQARDRWIDVALAVEEIAGERYWWVDFGRTIVDAVIEVLGGPGPDYAGLRIGAAPMT